jgi:hypothetical protein
MPAPTPFPRRTRLSAALNRPGAGLEVFKIAQNFGTANEPLSSSFYGSATHAPEPLMLTFIRDVSAFIVDRLDQEIMLLPGQLALTSSATTRATLRRRIDPKEATRYFQSMDKVA